MDEKIKVIIDWVYIKKNGALWGKNTWNFKVRVDGKEVGDPKKKFTVLEGMYVNLGSKSWSRVVKISGTKKVKIEFGAKEVAFLKPDDYGSVTHELKWPFRQTLALKLENKYFKVSIRVLLSVRKKFTYHNSNEVFACRTRAGKLECVTISGAPVRSRIEVCEVRPLPPAGQMPKRLSMVGMFPFKSRKGVKVKSTSPINLFPNPPVIPVIASGKATTKNSARIEVTFYQPRTLKFTADDARLEWKTASLDGKGKVAFVGGNKGLRVHLYGKAAGEVELKLMFNGAIAATYRALVKPIRRIPCRVTLLDGGKGYRAVSGPKSVLGHVRIANRFLRQAGVQLSLDSSKATRDGASRLQRGIFRVKLSKAKRGHARNVGGANPPAIKYNYRAKVLNIVYVVSMSDASVLGEAIARATSKAKKPAGGSFPVVHDPPKSKANGTPSTSWVKPSGVWPHKSAKQQKVELMNGKVKHGLADLWGMTITNGNKTWFQYGNTLAHEVGHMLGLCHREATQDLLPELGENLMHATNGPIEAQDLDIIQARAVQKSPMVK
jgi:hypothetical protein